MGKRKAKEFVILVALKYEEGDAEAARQFWLKYFWLFPHTSGQGLPEAAYLESGVSIYGQDSETTKLLGSPVTDPE